MFLPESYLTECRSKEESHVESSFWKLSIMVRRVSGGSSSLRRLLTGIFDSANHPCTTSAGQ